MLCGSEASWVRIPIGTSVLEGLEVPPVVVFVSCLGALFLKLLGFLFLFVCFLFVFNLQKGKNN